MPRTITQVLSGLMLALTLGGAGQAATVLESFSPPGACFARTYDASHLRTHPRQTVRYFYLGEPGRDWRDVRAAPAAGHARCPLDQARSEMTHLRFF